MVMVVDEEKNKYFMVKMAVIVFPYCKYAAWCGHYAPKQRRNISKIW